MEDGKHCPTCGKDIGFLPIVCAISLSRIWCPRCSSRLQYLTTRRFYYPYLFCTVAILAVAYIVAGLPALVPGMCDVPDFEAIVQFVVFASLSLPAVVGLE